MKTNRQRCSIRTSWSSLPTFILRCRWSYTFLSWPTHCTVTHVQMSASQRFFLFIGGLFIWTVTEYMLHRHVFHFIPENAWGKRSAFYHARRASRLSERFTPPCDGAGDQYSAIDPFLLLIQSRMRAQDSSFRFLPVSSPVISVTT